VELTALPEIHSCLSESRFVGTERNPIEKGGRESELNGREKEGIKTGKVTPRF